MEIGLPLCRTYSIGPYPEVTLDAARKARFEAKQLLREGRDPRAEKQTARLHQKLSAANTFKAIAKEWIDKQEREGRATVSIVKTKWLLGIAYPALGHRPISEIKAPEVLAVLRGEEKANKLETARRLRSTLSRVFRYAIATARAENDPTVALQGALTAPTVTHRPAILDPEKFGGLLRAIDGFMGQAGTRESL